ncbi:MAG: Nramp family divalent metal transporter [Candidatus Aminicenantes bacterium]|nr:Nramp family divalent metal transporter [Candidatus Aminicenantes bacterium]
MTIKRPRLRWPAREILKYIGPGLLVTVGFIDPGNWASNIAAGASYGYAILWIVTLSTIFLVLLQHNAAHLGIASGLCLAEAVTCHFPRTAGRLVLGSAMIAVVSTALAEILGAGIALAMLFHIPVKIGAALAAVFVLVMLETNSYRYLERWLIGLVSLIGLAFLYELTLVRVPWGSVASGWVTPAIPAGSMPLLMSVLGAVVMPHNIFLHSEIIQSRRWDLADEKTIRHQLKFEMFDTLTSMVAGWLINSAMIIVAAAVFFADRIPVGDLAQAEALLKPILGRAAGIVFAVALLAAGLSAAVTAGMTGATITAGLGGQPYDMKQNRSRAGAAVAILGALAVAFVLRDTFRGLIASQMLLSIQLPVTIFSLIALTSSRKVMGRFANTRSNLVSLLVVGGLVVLLNILLLLAALQII